MTGVQTCALPISVRSAWSSALVLAAITIFTFDKLIKQAKIRASTKPLNIIKLMCIYINYNTQRVKVVTTLTLCVCISILPPLLSCLSFLLL